MREIKFRVWDIETKQFFYWDITEQPPSCLIKEYIRKKSQQFTGLKDKNGKEIFEGDIVDSKLYDGTRKNYIVEFRDGSFCIGLTELGKWIEDVIVIGNIYESPELLKGL